MKSGGEGRGEGPAEAEDDGVVGRAADEEDGVAVRVEAEVEGLTGRAPGLRTGSVGVFLDRNGETLGLCDLDDISRRSSFLSPRCFSLLGF